MRLPNYFSVFLKIIILLIFQVIPFFRAKLSTFAPYFFAMRIIIINGPNLNLLGIREKGIYGNTSMEDYLAELHRLFPKIELDYFQSNVEGELINKIHEVGFSYDGIIINAGGYTHTSIALADAIAGVKTATVEVHISNVAQRETFRHKSYLGAVCTGSIAGFGLDSYRLGIEALIQTDNKKNNTKKTI